MRTPHHPLTVPRLLAAYRRGWFPMADPLTGAIEWFNPDPRAVIPLEGFRVPRNLDRECRRGRFDVRCDTAFEAVMRACAAPRPSERLTWIDERMIAAYVRLSEAGHAHSIEAWLGGKLVGGLYGVQIGGGFFGESMFCRPGLGGSNASKVCLVHLVRWMKRRGLSLLDTQFSTEHLDQFGCIEIPQDEYLRRLAAAVDRDVTWGTFAPQPSATMGPE
jgi:leucyl/phenylalanyl-tRNA---protein transferase